VSVDSAWEQDSAWAWKMLENDAENASQVHALLGALCIIQSTFD